MEPFEGSAVQNNVKGGPGEDSSETGLEEQSEVEHVVFHALHAQTHVAGLRDQQVRPLHDHDGHELTGLAETNCAQILALDVVGAARGFHLTVRAEHVGLVLLCSIECAHINQGGLVLDRVIE